MLKFIAISFIGFTVECAIIDKIEEILEGKNKHIEERDKEECIDTDTLNILKNYGLINIEQLKM